jgi:MoxR-like ATPase
MDIESLSREIRDLRETLLSEVGKVVVGMGDKIDLMLVALLARGHVLFEGVPGVAKTLVAKSLAAALGCEFRRVQFTPDLLPGDITGTPIFDRNRSVFEFKKGPVFTQILLADEINRAPAKTQSALLEAMQERQVSVDSTTYGLGHPFMVIATQNPVEQEGVYRLPEAQLDRFFLRVLFPYPTPREEVDILRMHTKDVPDVRPVTGPQTIVGWQAGLQSVSVRPAVYEYVAEMARASRAHPDVFLGMSPRASLCVLMAGQALALLGGRPYVTHHDVKRVAGPVLNHRILLKPEAELVGRDPSAVVEEILSKLPTVEAQA